MTDYEIFEKRRTIRQIILTIVFVTVLTASWLLPSLGIFITVCMFMGVFLAFWKGRKWCDWYCPRGSFFDCLVKLSSPNENIPPFFKSLPLRIGALIFFMAMMIVQLLIRWPDISSIGLFFVTMLTAVTILSVVLALFFHQRTWCYFCPAGSMSNWIGRNKYPLKIDSKLCVECGLCYKVCPMQIAPYKYKGTGIETVKDGDCIKCALCVNACPAKALKPGK